MKIVFRLFYFIFSVFLGSQVNAQDMSGWSDDRVCQHQGGFNDEVYARGLSCKELTKTNSKNTLSGVKSNNITFPGKYYTDEIKSCQAVHPIAFDSSYTPKFVRRLVGYDWHADWYANSNSMNVWHQKITDPMNMLKAATHNAVANNIESEIDISKELLVELAEADTLYDSIGYIEVQKKPNCYAGKNDINSRCWYHQYAFARDVFADFMITALWLKDKLNEKEFKTVNMYIKKMYKKFIKPIEFQKEEKGFYQMANGGVGILAYASWTDNKTLAAKEITHRFKEIDRLFYEDGYINDNSFRGYRAQWYHSYGVDSALGYVYVAKLWGAEVPIKLQKKLVKASEVVNLAITDWDEFKSRPHGKIPSNAILDPINAKKRTHEYARGLAKLMLIMTDVELEHDAEYIRKSGRYGHSYGMDTLVGFPVGCIQDD